MSAAVSSTRHTHKWEPSHLRLPIAVNVAPELYWCRCGLGGNHDTCERIDALETLAARVAALTRWECAWYDCDQAKIPAGESGDDHADICHVTDARALLDRKGSAT